MLTILDETIQTVIVSVSVCETIYSDITGVRRGKRRARVGDYWNSRWTTALVAIACSSSCKVMIIIKCCFGVFGGAATDRAEWCATCVVRSTQQRRHPAAIVSSISAALCFSSAFSFLPLSILAPVLNSQLLSDLCVYCFSFSLLVTISPGAQTCCARACGPCSVRKGEPASQHGPCAPVVTSQPPSSITY